MTAFRRHPRGFTLIEILSVVVILGIVSAVILPQVSSRDDLRVASASRQLMADLLYAQDRAIAKQKMVYVQFSTATNSYQVMDDSGTSTPGGVITHPVLGTSYVVTLGTGSMTDVKIQSASFDGNLTVAFDPMGVPYAYSTSAGLSVLGSGAVVLKAGAYSLTTSVSAYSGQITVH